MIHHNIVSKRGFLGDFGGAQPLRIKQQQNLGSSRQPAVYVADAFKVSIGMPDLLNATSPVEKEAVILEKL